jgi:hypothetical protein
MADGGHPGRPALPDPKARAALVSELAAAIELAASLSPAEAAVLRHILAYAGFGLDGRLRVPAFAVLWGGAGESYFPRAPIPEAQVRAAAAVLQRRGLLRVDVDDAAGHSSVVVDADALRALIRS